MPETGNTGKGAIWEVKSRTGIQFGAHEAWVWSVHGAWVWGRGGWHDRGERWAGSCNPSKSRNILKCRESDGRSVKQELGMVKMSFRNTTDSSMGNGL